jgi:hypothetical protein
MAKKNSSAKGEKLTIKQKKLVEALPVTNSIAEAGTVAGYSDRTAASRALKGIAERAPEVLERLGLTIDHVVDKCLRPLLEAKETKFFANAGVVFDTKEVEALDIRIRAIEVWARLMGAYTAQKVQLSGGLSLDFNHVSDDELDRTIAGLVGPSQPPTKA